MQRKLPDGLIAVVKPAVSTGSDLGSPARLGTESILEPLCSSADDESQRETSRPTRTPRPRRLVQLPANPVEGILERAFHYLAVCKAGDDRAGDAAPDFQSGENRQIS
jgi:hypothetical protein